MKVHQAIKLAFAILVFISLSSFSVSPPAEDNVVGVYSAMGDKVRLELKADHSYSWKDHSNPANTVEATGFYTQENNGISLGDKKILKRIPVKWKIKNNAATSRYKMKWIRLVKEGAKG